MEDLCIWTHLKLQQARKSVKAFFSSERGGAGIIAAAILIVLVIVLGIAFRETIIDLWGKIWQGMSGKQVTPPEVSSFSFS